MTNADARAAYNDRLGRRINDYLRDQHEEEPVPDMHESFGGKHYRSLCRTCIGADMELDALLDVARTTPDPDVALLALTASGSMLFGEDDDA
jgi:hypothetical protein